ncbi:MAG: prephenate dehydrogenase [Firmicutes bacterium]|nr:prephenate dehydrogenase [Bacillota bacterium]
MEVGIIGLGLIGGSLARALKATVKCKIYAYSRRKEPLEKAFADGNIDAYSTEEMSLFKNCDVIFICVGVELIPEFTKKLIPIIKKGAILTDVGSTKEIIFNSMLEFKDVNFIGGHPMAGSEKTGYENSNAHLFENAYYILTPPPDTRDESVELLSGIIKAVGAIPVIATPEEHDSAVAAISHLPHIVASALVATVSDIPDDKGYIHNFAAGGFRDTTRIAASSPSLWNGICGENRKNIVSVLKLFIKNTEKALELLSSEKDMTEFFEKGSKYRKTFNYKMPAKDAELSIFVDVADKPGAIASVSAILEDINIKNIAIRNSRDYSLGALSITFGTPEDKIKAAKLLKEKNYVVSGNDLTDIQ